MSIHNFDDFDGLEIHPCHICGSEDGSTYIEQCEPQEAGFWSVYGHCTEGGVECLEDFDTEEEGRAYAKRLLDSWPHLNTFGLLG